MKFIELGSEASYDYKDGLKVKVGRIINSIHCDFNPDKLGVKEGDIIEAGWMNTDNKKSIGRVLSINTAQWPFDDERKFIIEIQKIKEEK